MDKSFIISASDNLRPSTEGNEVKNFRSFHGLNNSHKHPVVGQGWLPAPTWGLTTAFNSNPADLTPSSGFCGHHTERYKDIQAGKTFTCTENKNESNQKLKRRIYLDFSGFICVLVDINS